MKKGGVRSIRMAQSPPFFGKTFDDLASIASALGLATQGFNVSRLAMEVVSTGDSLDRRGYRGICSAFPPGFHVSGDLVPESWVLLDFDREIVPTGDVVKNESCVLPFAGLNVARTLLAGIGVSQLKRDSLRASI